MTENPPIPANWVSREDLLHCCPDLEERIRAMKPDEIATVADKVGDALQDTYWLAMDIVLRDYFGDDQEGDTHLPG